ncbi:MAG: nicotinate (nicotinamide) nucleotide adenylyltransferase [Aquificae bacterium]|nr:nicotinate (nicotinamide) nucleotide adenylyltransferase [Aquificota bacterium]
MIGLFGGSFDPVHIGHLRIGEDIREYFSLEEIIFIPAYQSPLKPETRASAEDRLYMLKESIKYNPKFKVSDFELRRKEKSYTIYTAKYFVKKLGYFPAFIVGTDAFLTLHKWKEAEKIVKLLNFIVVGRNDFNIEILKKYLQTHFPNIELLIDKTSIDKNKTAVYFFGKRRIDVSSSEIRQRIKENKTITYLVLPEVEYYIIKKKLYRG